MSNSPCPVCLHYASVRGPVLTPALRQRAAQTGEAIRAVRSRFMRGVHARHRSGLPVLPKAVS